MDEHERHQLEGQIGRLTWELKNSLLSPDERKERQGFVDQLIAKLREPQRQEQAAEREQARKASQKRLDKAQTLARDNPRSDDLVSSALFLRKRHEAAFPESVMERVQDEADVPDPKAPLAVCVIDAVEMRPDGTCPVCHGTKAHDPRPRLGQRSKVMDALKAGHRFQ
jgi:hypothetical protein